MAATVFYIPTSNIREFQFLYILIITYGFLVSVFVFVYVFIVAIFTGIRWYFMVLIGSSLIISIHSILLLSTVPLYGFSTLCLSIH